MRIWLPRSFRCSRRPAANDVPHPSAPVTNRRDSDPSRGCPAREKRLYIPRHTWSELPPDPKRDRRASQEKAKSETDSHDCEATSKTGYGSTSPNVSLWFPVSDVSQRPVDQRDPSPAPPPDRRLGQHANKTSPHAGSGDVTCSTRCVTRTQTLSSGAWRFRNGLVFDVPGGW